MMDGHFPTSVFFPTPIQVEAGQTLQDSEEGLP